MGALAQAVRSGKALYVGLSNYDGETLEKASRLLEELHCPFIINQNRYSIFDRTVEQNGLKDTAARLHKGIIAFSPLAQGMLTDRYLHGIPEDSRIRTDGRFLKETAITPRASCADSGAGAAGGAAGADAGRDGAGLDPAGWGGDLCADRRLQAGTDPG